MQGLPCSDCRRHMVGHSESQGPVSVSIYARDLLFLYQHCRDGPKKIHTSRRVCFGTVAGCLFFTFLRLRILKDGWIGLVFQMTISIWTPFDGRKRYLIYSRKHLHFDLTYEKNIVTRFPSVLTVHYKSRKIHVRPLGKPYLKTLFSFVTSVHHKSHRNVQRERMWQMEVVRNAT